MENNNKTRTEKHAKKGQSKKLWIIICIACAVAAALIIIFAVLNNEEGNDKVYQDLKQEYVAEATPTPSVTPEPTPLPTMPISKQTIEPKKNPEVVPSDRYIDFTALKERNSDVIGWISVDGTEIDYPILQSKDNTDYLLNDIDGEENVNGAIFMDMANKTNYSDRNTVIYGHNMKNGTMFAGLHNFEDEEFFNENREIKVYTREGMRVYEIVAAYLTNDDNILFANNFYDDDIYAQYLEDMMNNENGNILDTEITIDDRLITLSTCQRGEAEHRYLVVGVLKQNEE